MAHSNYPKVMILAAGRGQRMGAMTDDCPKPLLKISGKPIIEYHLDALKQQGFHDIVINTAYLGHKLPEALGDGSLYGLNIQYSHEQALGLETAGGIINALPLLGNAPFIVINGDIWTDYDFSKLALPSNKLAHIVLVNNPEHNPDGDFSLINNNVRSEANLNTYTFSGIGVYHPDLFLGLSSGFRPLKEPLLHAISENHVSGELHSGEWQDIGTPKRLLEIEEKIL